MVLKFERKDVFALVIWDSWCFDKGGVECRLSVSSLRLFTVGQTDHRTDDYITEDNWQLLAMALKIQMAKQR